MTKEKYMALADLQTVWTNTLKPWIVAGFIAVTAVAQGETAQLVLQDGSLLPQSTFQAAGSYVTTAQMGVASGVATLDENGHVPSSQLPSYVDDVIEAANFAALPATGEGGKIYVTLDDNKTYRWGGSAYAEISASIALGETAGTAYEGSKGAALKTAYDTHAADTDIHVTAALQAAWTAKYDKPSTGIPKTDLASAVGASLDLADSAYQLPSTGIPSTDLAQAVQASLGAADSAIQSVKVNGTALTPDADKAVNVTFEIPERVTAQELAAFTV